MKKDVDCFGLRPRNDGIAPDFIKILLVCLKSSTFDA